MSKLTTTQNVIRNKFKKIHANRLVHEQNVEQTLKPLTATASSSTLLLPADDLETQNNQFSLRNLSKTINNIPQLRISNKSYSNHAIKSRSIKVNNDPNALCDDLRKLLSSSLVADKQLINTILEELYDLDIIE